MIDKLNKLLKYNNNLRSYISQQNFVDAAKQRDLIKELIDDINLGWKYPVCNESIVNKIREFKLNNLGI